MDIGNVCWFFICYGDVICYVQNVGWYVYFEGCWKEDVGDVIVCRYVQVMVEFIDDEVIFFDCLEEEWQMIVVG